MSSKEKLEFETYTAVKPSPEMMAKIESIIAEYCNRELEKTCRKLLPKIVEKVMWESREEKINKEEIVELKTIPKEKAKTLIQKYITKHHGCRTSDIIYDLRLDPDLVLEVLKKLETDKAIRGRKIGSKGF